MKNIRDNSGLIFIIFGLYIVLRFLNIAGNDLWFDEVFSVLTIRQSWQEMFGAVIRDGVHPPLFYILLKLWAGISQSIFWLQLFPLLISLFTVIPLFLLCRVLELTKTETSIVLLLISVNSYFLEYSSDLRMYGLVQFFTLFSLWLFVKFQKENGEKRETILFLLFANLLLVYTHYFGWLIVGLEGAYLLYRQRNLFFRFAAASTIVLFCFLPWIFFVLQNAANKKSTGNLEWLERPTFSSLTWFYSVLNGNTSIPHTTLINLLIFALPLAFAIWKSVIRKQKNFDSELLFCFAFIPVAAIFFLSLLLPKSIWETRYLIITAVPYIILLVKSVFALPTKFSKSIFAGIIIIWAVSSGIYNFLHSPKKIQWSEALQKIEKADKPIYVFEDWVGAPLWFYSNEAGFKPRIEKLKDLSKVQDKTFQIVFRFTTAEEATNQRRTLNEKDCNITQENVFSDVSQNVAIFNVENCN